MTVSLAASFLEEKFPAIWKSTFVKQIEPPATHASFKAVAVSFAATIAHNDDIVYRQRLFKTRIQTPIAINTSIAAAILSQYNFPTYYVGTELFKALQHTNPPTDRTWKDMAFPYPAMCFMIPLNTLRESQTEQPVLMMGYAKFPARDPHVYHIGQKAYRLQQNDKDRMCIFWSIGSGLVMQDCTFEAAAPLAPSPDFIDDLTMRYDPTSRYLGWVEDQEAPPSTFSSYMSGLVANLVLLMMSRPELITRPAAAPRKLKSGVLMHQPTFIGNKYRIKYDGDRKPPTGAHFTELRWRAGHWRTQHYGPGGSLTKEILIDPYIAYSAGLVVPEK